MRRNTFLKMAAIIVLALVALPATLPVHAVATSIGLFYGGCGNFSVDLAVTGTEDDGGGLDKTRFKVTDGAGKVLYQEDVGLQVGHTVGSQVYNLPYAKNMFPIKNPVHLAVVQLAPDGNEKWEVGFVTFNAPCLAPSGNPTRTGYQTPNALVKGTILATTHLFEAPGVNPLTLTVNPGNIFPVIYRNRDGSWVDIYVGGNELVWIPTSTIAVDVNALAFPPTHIFGSGLGAGDNGGGAAGAVGSGSVGGVTTRGTIYIHSEPSTSSAQIGYVPRNTGISVIGRDASANWLKISYKDVTGWVSAFYVNMSPADVRKLGVVQ
jgi:hypothetical protein